MRLACLIAIAACFASAASAEDSVDACKASYARAGAALGILRLPNAPPGEIALENGGCAAVDVEPEARRRAPRITYSRVFWASGAEGAIAFRVDAVPGRGASSMPGQAAASRESAEIALSLAPGAQGSTLVVYSVSFPGRNHFAFSSQASGLDMSSQGAFVASMGNMRLHHTEISFQSDGRLGSFIDQYAGERKPFRQRDRDRTEAVLDALPQSTLDQRSRTEALQLLAALPDPRGSSKVELFAPAGLSFRQLAQLFSSRTEGAELGALTNGVRLTVSFRP